MAANARIENLVEQLKTQRDEIRVRIHLAEADARDEWEVLEKKWGALSSRLSAAGGAAKATAKDVGTTVGMLTEELRDGYKAIRARLR